MRFTWGWDIIFKVVFLAMMTLSLATCKKKENFKHINISVHAASGLYNPSSFFVDNTSEAVNYALGFEDLNGIEIDIQLSSDGTLWMFHDVSLDERTDGNGLVFTSTDEYLESLKYNDLSSTKISKFSEIEWTLLNGKKNIYLDFKNLNTVSICETFNISNLVDVLDDVSSSNPKVKLIPIILNKVIAEKVYDSGYKVFTDIKSYEEGKLLSSSFYSGYFIRQKELTALEVRDLQNLGKNVIFFNVFSLSSVKKALRKEPYGVLVEDFKSAIIERN